MEQNLEKFRISFDNFIIQDLKKALNADVEVGVIILTVIGIECLSGYLTGKASNGRTFKKFIDRFMPRYSNHADTIYQCIRNGLAHDYIIKEQEGKSFVFTRNNGERHLTSVDGKPGWYYLNRENFALDFIEAQKQFFESLSHNDETRNKALQRLEERSFLDVFSPQPTSIIFNFDKPSDGEKYSGVTGTSSRNPYDF